MAYLHFIFVTALLYCSHARHIDTSNEHDKYDSEVKSIATTILEATKGAYQDIAQKTFAEYMLVKAIQNYIKYLQGAVYNFPLEHFSESQPSTYDEASYDYHFTDCDEDKNCEFGENYEYYYEDEYYYDEAEDTDSDMEHHKTMKHYGNDDENSHHHHHQNVHNSSNEMEEPKNNDGEQEHKADSDSLNHHHVSDKATKYTIDMVEPRSHYQHGINDYSTTHHNHNSSEKAMEDEDEMHLNHDSESRSTVDQESSNNTKTNDDSLVIKDSISEYQNYVKNDDDPSSSIQDMNEEKPSSEINQSEPNEESSANTNESNIAFTNETSGHDEAIPQ